MVNPTVPKPNTSGCPYLQHLVLAGKLFFEKGGHSTVIVDSVGENLDGVALVRKAEEQLEACRRLIEAVGKRGAA
jgi:hypothetical protein